MRHLGSNTPLILNAPKRLITHKMSLAGKVAIITGGSKGIGKTAALRLAQEGASVAIGYHSDASGAQEVVEKVGSDRAVAIQLNAGKVDEISKFVEQTVNKFRKIDLVIAAAGKMTMNPLEALTEEVFDSLFELNVKGPMFLVQVLFHSALSGKADVPIESRTPHGSWIACRPVFYDSMCCVRGGSSLRQLYCEQGGH